MMRVESWIVSLSSTRTGSDLCPVIQRTRGTWKPGRSERRTCAMPFQSSAQRAFSLKCEKRNCQRTGGVISRSADQRNPPAGVTIPVDSEPSGAPELSREQFKGVAPVRASEALGRVAVRIVEDVGEELCLR